MDVRRERRRREKEAYTGSFLVGLKPFPAPLKAEIPSREWKEIDNLKMSETLGMTRFMFLRVSKYFSIWV